MEDRERVSILIIHGLVLAGRGDTDTEIIVDGGVAIRGDRIIDVDKSDVLTHRYDPEELVDARGDLIIPGFVNGHLHTMQTFGRGLSDLDHPSRRAAVVQSDPMGNTQEWGRNAWLIDSGLDDESAATCAQLAMIEMLKSGTTCYADVCAFNVDVLANVVGEVGIRAVLAKNTSDIRDLGMPLPDKMVRHVQAEVEDSISLYERWNGAFDGRLQMWLGLHALWACSNNLCRAIAAEARRLGTGVSMHLAQTKGEASYAIETRGGLRSVPLMESLGVFDGPFLAIHSAYLDEADIECYKRHDVAIVHCPVAAMK